VPLDPLTDIDDEVDAYVARWGAGRWESAIKRLTAAARAIRTKGAALDGRVDAAEARLTALETRVTALERARP
jgi:hypothetical protein